MAVDDGDGGGQAALAAAFAGFDLRLDRASRAPLALGLSGGSDSLALLAFATEWARTAGRRVLALTVDHGLHSESAAWTARAGAAARRLGADWRALAWRGPKPDTALQATARRARHALLAEAARTAGAPVLLLAHTADDVAESVLIRRETPGHGRLRDWAPSPVWPEGRGVFVLRPLLGVRRGALRAALAVRSMDWLEDPSNADTRFARARARRELAAALPPLLDDDDMGRCVGLRGRAGGGAAWALPGGMLSLGVEGDRALPAARLGMAVACVAGRETPPGGAGLARLCAWIARGEGGAATLGGARVDLRPGEARLSRERGRRPPATIALAPGEGAVFDGRFEVLAEASGWRAAPLAGHAAALDRDDRARLAAIPALARPALPVLLHEARPPHLPRPFGRGPGEARDLVAWRFAAATGRIGVEGDIGAARDPATFMALDRVPSYLGGRRAACVDRTGV